MHSSTVCHMAVLINLNLTKLILLERGTHSDTHADKVTDATNQ